MNKIEVAVLHESHNQPGGMMMFLARLTQRGHSIETMDDLLSLYYKATDREPAVASLGGPRSKDRDKMLASVAALPHGTIKRFTPVTVAIVGASRRFLAQARTHQVGFNYVSASLQYSDYSGKGRFVVPYSMIEADHNALQESHAFASEHKLGEPGIDSIVDHYLESCEVSMEDYKYYAQELDNDTAGYIAPQGLRNILIMQANVEAWSNFISLRACNRNTVETQYVTLRIWEELLKTRDGAELFIKAEPDCLCGGCREGKFSCYAAGNTSLIDELKAKTGWASRPIPRALIDAKFPLLER